MDDEQSTMDAVITMELPDTTDRVMVDPSRASTTSTVTEE